MHCPVRMCWFRCRTIPALCSETHLGCMQLLSAAGFGATVRDSAAPASAAAATILRKRDERARRLADSTTRLILSWTLAITCFAGACHLPLCVLYVFPCTPTA